MSVSSDLSVRLWRNIQDKRSDPFWIGQNETRTFGDLEIDVRKATGLLRRDGVSIGDTAVIITPDDWKTFSFWLACVLNGVTPVILAPDSGAARIAAICAIINPKLMLVSAARAKEPWAAAVKTVYVDETFGQGPESPDAPSCMQPIDGTACIIFTSGTTSAPKGVVITHENLDAQLETIARVFLVEPASRLFNGLVLYHVDGLFQGPLLALWASAALLRPPQFSPSRIASDMDWLVDCDATHMVTAPTFLELMDRTCTKNDYFDCEAFVAIVSSSAKLSKELWGRIEARFDVTVINEYGMTETVAASHFAGNLPEMGARYGIGKPIDCEARLMSKDGVVSTAGQTGELQVRGKNVFAGYYGDPDRTAAAFHDGWLCTGDLARKNEAGDYEIVGRLNTAINFGGFLILPEEIDEAICRHPKIRQSKTVGIDDEMFGQVPFSVFVSDSDIAPQQIIEFCRMHLEARKVPKRAFRVERLPVTGSGKPDTAAVKNMILGRFPKRGSAKDDLVDKILKIASDVFGVPPDTLSPASCQESTTGWDSYAHTTLMLETEQALNIEIPASDMMAIISLSELAETVRRILTSAEDVGASRIQAVRTGEGKGSLVFMPGIAGRAAYAGRLLPHLTDRVSIYSISIDPKVAQDGTDKSIVAMAQVYAEEIEAVGLPQPVTLLGSSFGGFLAYETGAELLRRGISLRSAILLDTAVPWTQRRFRHVHKAARLLRQYKAQIKSATKGKLPKVREEVFEIETFGKVDLSQFPKRQHATVKQSLKAMSTYQPSRSSVPVFVFSAANRKQARLPMGPHLGWGRFSSADVSSMTLGQAHISILQEDDLAKIAAERVNALLERDG